MFCPRCGKEAGKLYGKLCADCLREEVRVMEAPNVLEVSVCPACGAYLVHGRGAGASIEEAVKRELERGLKMVQAGAELLGNDVEMAPVDDYSKRAILHVSADVSGLRVEEEHEVEIRLKKSACDSCSRLAGGYYEAVIQIRSSGGKVEKHDRQRCRDIVSGTVSRLYPQDRMAFISKTDELREGIDFYIGSKGAAKHICKAITDSIGGTIKTSYSLAGKRGGRDVYRVTYAVRLPQFRKYDVVGYNGQVILVERMGERLTGMRMSDGGRVVLNQNEIGRVERLCSVEDAVRAVVVTSNEREVQVMDPDTYEVLTLPRHDFMGDSGEIFIIKTHMGVFPVSGELVERRRL